MLARLKDERGISAVIVAVSLIGLFGAAVLSIDAGSAWATRRKIVTGTDSAALGAARMYAAGLADPCTPAGVAAGEAEGTTILTANAAEAEHNATSTPNGYEVTVTGCGTSSKPVGHVRFDGRLGSQQGFSGLFGFTKVKPFSSSTAEFGYVTAITGGLRPFTVCDQHAVWNPDNPPPNPLPVPSNTEPNPHFALWNWLKKGQITQAQYDSYFGSSAWYPSKDSNNNSYLTPAQGGGVVHRVNLLDSCPGSTSFRGWVDYDGDGGGTGNELDPWLENGYPGTVSLDPHECGSGIADGDCNGFTGNKNGSKGSLDKITCPPTTPSKDCFTFPVILNNGVQEKSSKTEITHVAFLFVILRGYEGKNPCQNNGGCELYLEFVDIQATGKLGSNPSGSVTTPRGTALCGIDHDSAAHRCDV